jgi:hypothetical protein
LSGATSKTVVKLVPSMQELPAYIISTGLKDALPRINDWLRDVDELFEMGWIY